MLTHLLPARLGRGVGGRPETRWLRLQPRGILPWLKWLAGEVKKTGPGHLDGDKWGKIFGDLEAKGKTQNAGRHNPRYGKAFKGAGRGEN